MHVKALVAFVSRFHLVWYFGF